MGVPSMRTSSIRAASWRSSSIRVRSRAPNQCASSSASARGPRTARRPASATPGQSAATARRHGSIRAQARSETMTRSRSGASRRPSASGVRPFARVDHEPVDHPEELLELRLAERKPAAPAQEHGQVGHEQRLDDAGRRRRGASSQPDRHHLRADRAVRPALGEAAQIDVGVQPVAIGAGIGQQEDRPGRVPVAETVEDTPRGLLPLGRHPGDVREHPRAQRRRLTGQRRRLVQPAELGLDGADRRRLYQCRRQERPSRWRSSSAAAGPHVPAG